MVDKVQQFLDGLERDDPVKHAIIMQVRALAWRLCPQAQERFMYNGIVVYAGAPVCGYFARKAHVTVELERGCDLADPAGVLEGTGKNRRHIKLQSSDDIAARHLEDYLSRAFAAAGDAS